MLSNVPLGRDGHFRVVAAGGVHEHRGRAELARHRFVRLASEARSSASAEKYCAVAAGFANGLGARFAALGIAPEHGHLRAGGGESIGQRAAEHAGGADDDGDFLGEIKEVRHKMGSPAQSSLARLASPAAGHAPHRSRESRMLLRPPAT